MLENLKEEVLAANRALEVSGLAALTWGNVSGIDREKGLIVIKPSGIPYLNLEPDSLVVVDRHGTVAEGSLKPSSDTKTHLILYRAFESIGGITHTHSRYATSFAQACRPLPCLGTTHADIFCGTVPVARPLTHKEIADDYESSTGRIIAEHFREHGLDPAQMPAVLAAHHGPFTWGGTAAESFKNALALEAVAEMAFATELLNADASGIPAHYLKKHFERKHGPDAYYGQEE